MEGAFSRGEGALDEHKEAGFVGIVGFGEVKGFERSKAANFSYVLGEFIQ